MCHSGRRETLKKQHRICMRFWLLPFQQSFQQDKCVRRVTNGRCALSGRPSSRQPHSLRALFIEHYKRASCSYAFDWTPIPIVVGVRGCPLPYAEANRDSSFDIVTRLRVGQRRNCGSILG